MRIYPGAVGFKTDVGSRLVADLRGNLVGDHGERELARAVGAWALAEPTHRPDFAVAAKSLWFEMPFPRGFTQAGALGVAPGWKLQNRGRAMAS